MQCNKSSGQGAKESAIGILAREGASNDPAAGTGAVQQAAAVGALPLQCVVVMGVE